MLPNLADQAAATNYGYGTIATGMFARASARVRAFAKARGYAVDADEYSASGRGPIFRLPYRPVRSITSITNMEFPSEPYALEYGSWVLRNGGVLETPSFSGNLVVVYDGGPLVLSDELIELVCGIASRMANTAAGAATGVQQETGGSESVTYGFDAYSGISDLTTGEIRSLDRMFPALPSVTVLRP